MSTAGTLLDQASSVLAESTPHSTRAACWIARAALEVAVDELLGSRFPAPEASMRSKLTILHVAQADKPSISARADYVWNRLSQACHHHAFELSPTTSEAGHLIQEVRALTISRP